MRHMLNLLGAAGLAAALGLTAAPALGQSGTDYRVRDLLTPPSRATTIRATVRCSRWNASSTSPASPTST